MSVPYDSRIIHTRFPYASTPEALRLAVDNNSPDHHSRGTRSAITPCGVIGLPLLVSIRFQVLFHSPYGVLFTFQSPYWSTIGRQGVFSLMGWSPPIPTRFLVPGSTWETSTPTCRFRLRGFHPLWPGFPAGSANNRRYVCLFRFSMTFPQPPVCNGLSLHIQGLDSYRFARRY